MKGITLVHLLFLSALTFPLFGTSENLLEWKDIYGRTFEAEIVSANPAIVRLRNGEGKEIDFQTMHLTPESQAQIRDWENKKRMEKEGTPFVQSIKDDLVKLEGKSLKKMDSAGLEKVKYFAFYKSASWCPPCRKFTPDLVRFYNQMKSKHPEFELIFISHDRSEDDMKDYMLEDEMEWPAFKHGKQKNVVRSNGNGIPCLIVTDANGNKLHDSYNPDGTYRGPRAVMREIESLLN